MDISIFSLKYFVATKLKAFKDRGLAGDIRFSQDLEDLTELIDGATNLEKMITNSEQNTKSFKVKEFKEMIAHRNEYREAMYGFLGYDDAATREKRLDRIFEILEKICK